MDATQPFEWSLHDDFAEVGAKLYPDLWDLKDADGKLLAWLEKRPSYCDRGNWKGNIELPCGLDWADNWPNYYMSLDRAKKEIIAFLRWRLFKERCAE